LGLVQVALVEQVSLLIQMVILDLPAEILPLAPSLLRLEAGTDLVAPQQAERLGLLSWHQTQAEPQQQMVAQVELGCRSQRILLQCAVVLEEVLEEGSAPQMQHFKAEQEDVQVF
jgi:hypothetical protein